MNKVVLDTSECDRIAAKLGTNVDAVVRRAAFEIEALAKDKAPWDTTALKNSIYTSTSKENNYSVADAAAKSKNPKAITEPIPVPEKEGYANVGPCVVYAARVEYGFVGEDSLGRLFNQAAQPYLTPAAEEIAKKYNSGKEWENIHL